MGNGRWKDLSYFMSVPEEFDQLSDEDRITLHIGESIEGETLAIARAPAFRSPAEEGATDEHTDSRRVAPWSSLKDDGSTRSRSRNVNEPETRPVTGRPKPSGASRIAQQSQSTCRRYPTCRRRSGSASPRFAKRCAG